MKKILLYSLIITLLLTGCGKKETEIINNDSNKFKEEYESLNNKENYENISIKEKNPIVYSSLEEIIDVLENKSGLIYLGYPESSSCRNNLPILLEAAYQAGLNKIYYLNVKNINSDKKSEEQLNIIKKYIDNFDGINVLFVKDKENIKTNTLLDSDYKIMSEEEKAELLKSYKNLIHEMLDDLCDQSC